jgi:hypothetical protein
MMTRRLCGAIFGLSLVFLCSCQSLTYVGTTHLYPDGAKSDEAIYRATFEIRGEPGEAFVARTKKTVHLTIASREGRTLFSGSYTVTGADVKTGMLWNDGRRVEAAIYECPPGNECKLSTPEARIIQAIHLERIEANGHFAERAT